MTRWIITLLVLLTALPGGCSKLHTYTSYEVVRTPDRLKEGDEVRVVSVNGGALQGTVTRIEGSRLTIATLFQGRRSIQWEDIRVLERIQKTTITEY